VTRRPLAGAGRRPILAFDTATTEAVVALGPAGAGETLASDRWPAGFRHGEELLVRIDRILERNGVGLADIGAIAIGTGPGAFTGLRVGLATAKGLAHALGVPIVGVPTSTALLAAARAAGSTDPLAVLLPAGPTDRIVVVTDPAGVEAPPRRLGPDEDPALGARTAVVAVDLDGRAESAEGETVRAGLGAAILAIASARLASGAVDDLATLVPEYVTLPRGVTREVGVVTLARG
jgi:tRNA threonylcarbamoyl adenosine modification protein YeaZ